MPFHRRAVVLLAACPFLFVPYSLQAQTVTPFSTFNQSPVIQVHGLPAIDSARVLTKGRKQYRLIYNVANNYTTEQRSSENVLFDGETTRMTFAYTQGLPYDLEWGVRIPYVNHEGGSLDRFIVAWHDMLGLPQGGRRDAPRSRLVYRYQLNGITLLDQTNAATGIGDLRFNGAWQWRKAQKSGDSNIAFRASLSVPTGDSDNLLGSGGMDAAFWFSADREDNFFSFPGSSWAGGGVLLLGNGDVLADQQREIALFGSVGGGARVLPWLSLKLQLDVNTALYDKSHFVQIDGNSVQLVMGGDILWSKNILLDLAVKEDPTVHASPDVVFHMGLTIKD